jgi:hypothetical protein
LERIRGIPRQRYAVESERASIAATSVVNPEMQARPIPRPTTATQCAPSVRRAIDQGEDMKRATLLAALAAAGTTVAVVAVSAAGQSPGTAGAKTIQVVEKRTSFKLVDNGRKGESAGDIGLLDGNLLANSGDKKIGRYQGVCTVLKPASGQTQCTFTLSLPDGQITSQAGYGPGFNGNKVVHEAVVGGTHAYSDARGEVVAEEANDTTGKLTIQLAG